MSLTVALRAGFALLLALVTWLTLGPAEDEPAQGFALMQWLAAILFGDTGQADKIGHFLAYASLGAVAALGRLDLAGRAAFTVAALAFYGLALEGAQGLMGHRDADLLDALANTAGAAAGMAAGRALLAFAGARA